MVVVPDETPHETEGYIMSNLVNIFGESDDTKQALYSAWANAEDAKCILQAIVARHRFNKELVEELTEVMEKLDECGDAVKDWAPNYYKETMEGWGQASAELGHP
jgi:hypothetical protein